ncbi:MAG: hypothetical protein ABJN65_05890 [Parasphingorhabdus sp.]
MTILAMVLMLASPITINGASDKPLSVNIEDASSALAMDTSLNTQTPIAARWNFVAEAIQSVHRAAVKRTFDKGLRTFLRSSNGNLDEGGGFLLKVTIVTDEFGGTYLPRDFLAPIGAGFNPIDAYSEYLNRPAILQGSVSIAGKRNVHYIWVEKQANHVFEVKQIPAEFNGILVRKGTQDAASKVRFRATRSGIPPKYFDVIPRYSERAGYWSSLVAERAEALRTAEKFDRANELQTRFNKLQLEHTDLQRQAEAQARRITANSTLISYMRILIQAAEQVSSLSQNGDATAPEVQPTSEIDIEVLREQNKEIRLLLQDIRDRMKERQRSIRRTDRELQRIDILA